MGCRDKAWFDQQRQVLEFAHALANGGWFAGDSFEAILGFFATPWRWDDRFIAWCAAGRPKSFEVSR